MVGIKDFEKVTAFEWIIPKMITRGMQVPIRFFASEALLKNALNDLAFVQAINASSLKGLIGDFCVMPDVHQGYGFPIGGVAASDFEKGVVSPGGIGYDINCGVRLLASGVTIEDALPFLENLALLLYQACPGGIGKNGAIKLSKGDLLKVASEGSRWALGHGLATKADLELTEDNGCIAGADLSAVSTRAIERGLTQLGSLGSGNHFIEVDLVEEVFNEVAANKMGLYKGHLVVQIHTGSRGFGHQICTDYVGEFQSAMPKYQLTVPDRELVCAPIQSREGQSYLAAMACAANFAFCNRQLLTSTIRAVFEKVFSRFPGNGQLELVYDLAHNIAKTEIHTIHGKHKKVCVHRKGATRAFGPGKPEIPQKYREIGQPVLIPGSMGTSSWVMIGTENAMEKSFGSCCHGAGRLLSRSLARKKMHGNTILKRMMEQGIYVRAGSLTGLAEESPDAYKDIDAVIASVIGAGLVRKVAKLRPLVVIKG